MTAQHIALSEPAAQPIPDDVLVDAWNEALPLTTLLCAALPLPMPIDTCLEFIAVRNLAFMPRFAPDGTVDAVGLAGVESDADSVNCLTLALLLVNPAFDPTDMISRIEIIAREMALPAVSIWTPSFATIPNPVGYELSPRVCGQVHTLHLGALN